MWRLYQDHVLLALYTADYDDIYFTVKNKSTNTVIKGMGGGGNYTFSTDGTVSQFRLNSANVFTIYNLPTGTYTVTEHTVSGYTVDSKSKDVTVSNGDDFFATDNTQCKKIIPIIAATANFADKIGYFTKTNLQQRGLLKRVNLEDIDTSKPCLINFYGGAGIGKSTTAMLITAELKKMGLNADYINETAKLHIYNGESYLPHSAANV